MPRFGIRSGMRATVSELRNPTPWRRRRMERAVRNPKLCRRRSACCSLRCGIQSHARNRKCRGSETEAVEAA